jgi:hypothetical protein
VQNGSHGSKIQAKTAPSADVPSADSSWCSKVSETSRQWQARAQSRAIVSDQWMMRWQPCISGLRDRPHQGRPMNDAVRMWHSPFAICLLQTALWPGSSVLNPVQGLQSHFLSPSLLSHISRSRICPAQADGQQAHHVCLLCQNNGQQCGLPYFILDDYMPSTMRSPFLHPEFELHVDARAAAKPTSSRDCRRCCRERRGHGFM